MKILKKLLGLFFFGVFSSCTFNESKIATRATFTFPNNSETGRPIANYACLNVWGPDGRWNSTIKSMTRDSRDVSVEFEVPYLWVGRSYTFRIIGFDTDPSQGSALYSCPIAASSTEINELGILENKRITKDISQVLIPAHSGFFAADLCGEKSGNSCYATAFYTTHESATLKDGTKIEKVGTANPNFKIWRETSDPYRLLKASGLWSNQNDWQLKLIANGQEFRPNTQSDNSFRSIEIVENRTCPQSVYLDSTHKTGGNCFYYTGDQGTTALNVEMPMETEDFLNQWSNPITGNGSQASFYEGNIKGCKIGRAHV